MESQLSHVMDERKCADKESLGLRNQLDEAEDRVRVCSKPQNHLYVGSYIVNF